MNIRKASLDDLDLLRAFAEKTFRIAYEHDNDPLDFEDYCQKAFSREQFGTEMTASDSDFWLGFELESLAGYIKLNYNHHLPEVALEKTVQVERIYIAPELQGKGLGEQFLEFTMQRARELKLNWVWLSVWKKNPRAIRFYERCGYVICGVEIFTVGSDDQEDWVMKKPVL